MNGKETAVIVLAIAALSGTIAPKMAVKGQVVLRSWSISKKIAMIMRKACGEDGCESHG